MRWAPSPAATAASIYGGHGWQPLGRPSGEPGEAKWPVLPRPDVDIGRRSPGWAWPACGATPDVWSTSPLGKPWWTATHQGEKLGSEISYPSGLVLRQTKSRSSDGEC